MNRLILEHLPPQKWHQPVRWRVVQNIYFTKPWSALVPGFTDSFDLTIPAGFITDGASIPRLLWPLFSPTGKHMRAAVVHDYLYHLCKSCGRAGVRSRKMADKLFLLAMLDSGVSPIRAKLMYWAVRVFGGSRFNRR